MSDTTKPRTFEEWRETALWYGVMEPDPSEDYTSEGQTIYRLCNAAASEAWAAARKQALEEAARIAERTYAKDAFQFVLGTEAAAAIRKEADAK